MSAAPRPCPAALGIIAAMVAAAALVGCTDDTPIAPAEAIPEKQFIFEGVHIEERQNADVSWVGTAKRTAGDLSRADAEGIVIHHRPQGSQGDVIDIYSPRGQLGFDDRTATLQSVRIVAPQDRVITGGVAHYEGAKDRVQIEGPLHFTSPGLTMTATSGEVNLKDNSVVAEGPILGRFEVEAKDNVPKKDRPVGHR